MLVNCACDPSEVRPYKHFLYDREGDRMVELKVKEPREVIEGESTDGFICQTEEGFRVKEKERIDLKEALKACQEQQQ